MDKETKPTITDVVKTADQCIVITDRQTAFLVSSGCVVGEDAHLVHPSVVEEGSDLDTYKVRSPLLKESLEEWLKRKTG